jgi:cyclohexyl-isocyanide hydratase
VTAATPEGRPLAVGMLLFPGLTQLDLTGPYEVFARLPNARVHLLGASLEPVRSDSGLTLRPDTSFADAPALDVLFVPGGPGVNRAMEDATLLAFLRGRAERARYVTAVCTGSLVLAAAGLLAGYRATTHWLSLDLLAMFPGVTAVAERVVVDRTRVTAGGVTAGIDFAFVVAAELVGADAAREVQLLLEYDPAPPFAAGSPRTAAPALVERVAASRHALQAERRALVRRLVGG